MKHQYGHVVKISSRPAGTTMTLWTCGVHILDGKLYASNPICHIGNNSSPCMHRTRDAARYCQNRAAYLRGGEAVQAPDLRGTIVAD
jgi:hypothetical protein